MVPLSYMPLSPNQVVRCCLEHAASVAKTFLMSDCVVVEIKEPEPVPAVNPMDNSGKSFTFATKHLMFNDIFGTYLTVLWFSMSGYGY